MILSSGEWIALQLWEFSFIPLGLMLLALSLASAAGVYLWMIRKTPVRHSTALAGAIALGAVAFVVLVFTWTAGVIVPASGPVPFDSNTWHSRPWMQWGMALHMVESDYLLGMGREQVLSLLGYGDGSYHATAVKGRGEMDAWRLYRPQDLLIPIPPELVVFYEDGYVARAWIQPWNLSEEVMHDSSLE